MFSSASIKKGKKTSIGSYAQEQERIMGEGQNAWQNKNIDDKMPLSHAVRVIENTHGGSVKAAIEGRIAAAGVKRKVRDNAVTHLTVYASMPDYSNRSDDERDQFVHLLKKFLEKKYGENNVVDLRWHFDESSPHLHATVVPITKDGRLCAKELFAPTKKSMEKWQKEYYAQVAQPLHYSMPDFGHSSKKGYTKETVATRKQLECVQGKKETAEQDLAQLEAQVEQVRARNRAAVERNRELGERARNLTGEVQELRSHVSGLTEAIRAVSAALADVPAALDMAAHRVSDGFRKAMSAIKDGLIAQQLELLEQLLKPEPEPEPEHEPELEPEHEWTLDELAENYSEGDYGNGSFRSVWQTDDHDL